MYSRQTSGVGGYTADYLRAKYAEKTTPRRSPFKEPERTQPPAVSAALPAPPAEPKPKEPSGSGISDFISGLEGDDILLLAVLALVLLGDGGKKDLDLILAAALIFIEFS